MTLTPRSNRSPLGAGAPQRAARRRLPMRAACAGASVVVAASLATGLAAAIPASASTRAPSVTYTFKTLDNSNDLTFNQLLGINDHGVIAGYYGSGAQFHKNKGYLLLPPYRQLDYRVENFPGSAQTQVTGLNDVGVTVGFYSHTNNKNQATNANFGFYAVHDSHFHTVIFPSASNSAPPVNQLLGVNNHDIAVGFYVDAGGNAHGYTYNISTGKFARVIVPGAVSVTATAINNAGSVAGFFTDVHGNTKSFLHRSIGQLIIFAKSGYPMTQAFGVNKFGEVVGAVTTNGGSTYGFTWTATGGFRLVSDPKGIGSTIINGVNDTGDLVGFYNGRNGNVNGMLAIP